LANPSREYASQKLKQLILTADKIQQLPSEPKLAEMLGVSRATVRSILDELCAAGWVTKHPGSGTFINQLIFRSEESFSGYMNFRRMIEKSGAVCTVERLGVLESVTDQAAAKALQLPESEPVVTMRLLFSSDGRPTVLCEDHFPRSLMTSAQLETFRRNPRLSLHAYLFECSGFAPTLDATQIYSISSAQVPEIASVFHLEGQEQPLLQLISVQSNWKNLPMIYSRIFADTHILSFKINRKME
jgi:GntR family transcriptional regulator